MEFPRSSERIERDYNACLDSVGEIDHVEAIASADRDEKDIYNVRRNVKHLEMSALLTDWGDKDLSPLTSAITRGNAMLP